MNGATKVADQSVSNMGLDWKIAATADFNGDGKTDILWRNDFGSVAIWTMNGGVKVADQVVSNLGNDLALPRHRRLQRRPQGRHPVPSRQRRGRAVDHGRRHQGRRPDRLADGPRLDIRLRSFATSRASALTATQR